MNRGEDRDAHEDQEQNLAQLLDEDRELNEEERRTVMAAGTAMWQNLARHVSEKARAAYAVANPIEFRECLLEHLDEVQRLVMVSSEVYHCNVCGRLLKDRGSPVASGILAERGRLAALLNDVERTPSGPERSARWGTFRAALGLPRKTQ